MEYSVYNRNLAPSNDDVDWLHVFQKKEHIHRLPPELRQKSSSFLSKRCKGRLPDTLGQARANPRKAVPQFYMPKGGKLGHLQLLLPIRMGDDETQPPDCALVMRLTNHNNYSIITILDKNQVYRHPFPLPPQTQPCTVCFPSCSWVNRSPITFTIINQLLERSFDPAHRSGLALH
jgi:hypothetical protein